MANPGSSAYGFGLDRSDPKNAGQFVVSFRADHNSEVQSWVSLSLHPPRRSSLTLSASQPVKVVPGAFSLLGQEHGDVMALVSLPPHPPRTSLTMLSPSATRSRSRTRHDSRDPTTAPQLLHPVTSAVSDEHLFPDEHRIHTLLQHSQEDLTHLLRWRRDRWEDTEELEGIRGESSEFLRRG